MTATPDYSDWSTPVDVIDRSTAIVTNAHIASFASIGPVDVSRYAALVVSWTNLINTVGTRVKIDLIWQDSNGNNLVFETITAHSMVSYANGYNALQAVRSAKGPKLTITVATSDGTGLVVGVQGITRPPLAEFIGSDSNVWGRPLLNSGLVATNAGATSATFYIPPVARAVAVRLGVTVATAPISAQINAVGYLAGFQAVQLADINGNGNQSIQGLAIPDSGLEIAWTNNDTVTRQIRLTVLDVS